MAQRIATDDVEQLWYTWSTIGLDALVAGFRVRAASPGLTDLYGERMRQLGRYLRYSLPTGSDLQKIRPFSSHERALLADDAPVCLALVRTESGERALVHKVYTGKDGRGDRPGVYFAHMLANLPQDSLLASDAIRFWRSPFWRTADVSEDTHGTDLSPVLLQWRGNGSVEIRYKDSLHYRLEVPGIRFKNIRALEQEFKGVDLSIGSEVYEHLYFLIRAYLLLQKDLEDRENSKEKLRAEIEEHKQELGARGKSRREVKELKEMVEVKEATIELMDRAEPKRIFIAAPPDEVAYLIAGLTRLVPLQFLRDFTFSTYESDVLTKLPLDIVGTCPPPVPLNRQSTAPFMLPAACEQMGFVLNTYSATPPNLSAITNLGNIDYAESYARFAVEQLQSMIQSGELSFTPLESIEDVDLLFKEVDDYLRSKNALQPNMNLLQPNSNALLLNMNAFQPTMNVLQPQKLSVSDFLDIYDTEILRQLLSLSEITDILRDPGMATRRLEKIRFRTQIFDRPYPATSTPEGEDVETPAQHLSWLSNTFPGLITDLLRSSHSPLNSSTDLMKLLGMLSGEATKELQKTATARQDDPQRFLALLNARMAFIDSTQQDSWPALFDSLRQTQPFIDRHWDIRTRLLKIATSIPTLESGTSADFLLDVPLADFGRLLESLPSTVWKHKAALAFLEKVTNSRRKTHGLIGQEQELVYSLETNFDQIKKLIQLLLASPLGQHTQPPWARWRATALDLLWLFTNSADQYKDTLLTLWLDDVRMRNILPDRPLDSLKLNHPQEEMVLKEYGPAFMQLSDGGKIVAPLFWRMAANRSSQKMELLSTLLEKRGSLENFAALLDPHHFSSTYRLNAEEIHVLLMGCSTDYANEYAKISNPTHASYQRPKSLPQYLRLYPQVPFWREAITILGQAKHPGKMPLIHAWTTVTLDEQKQKIPKIPGEQITELLDGAVVNDEYYAILRQHGPAMLRIPSLAPHVPSYYMTLNADTTLLYTLLDTYLTLPIDYNIAEPLMEMTSSLASNNSAREFVHRYAKNIPQLCYHLTMGQNLCKQLGWQEIRVYIYDWLRDGIEKQELEDIFANVPLEKVDYSLIEDCGEIALEKFPQSTMLLTLTRYYLNAFGPDRLKSAKGEHFIDFLFKYKQKNYFPKDFAGLGELIQDFHSIRQFLLEPKLQQLQKIFRLINTKDSKLQWIELVANALVAHLDYSGDLGFIISSLSLVDRKSVSFCLLSMVDCVKDDTKKANNSRWQQATILLESALLPDLLDYIPEDVSPEEIKNAIINKLLKDSSPEFRSYINQQSQFWLPEIQEQWRAVAKRYGFTLPPINRSPAKSIPSHPVPAQKTTTASPIEPAALSTTASTIAAPQTQPVPSAPSSVPNSDPEEASSGLRGWLRAWLIFPWLFLRLGLLCRESGNGPLVLFWSNHRKALIQNRRLTPYQWKQRLKFACDFYSVSQKETPTADQELWLIIKNIIENNTQFLKKLDYHEIKRIHLAAHNLNTLLPSQVPSLSEVSKKGTSFQLFKKNQGEK